MPFHQTERTTMPGIRDDSVEQFRERLNHFPQRYIHDWNEWISIAPSDPNRPTLFVIITCNNIILLIPYICCNKNDMHEVTNPINRYGARAGGVRQSDVSHAADTLLRAGNRPTVERIRTQLGRGSPNTINPMLDAWWKTLSARLDSGPAALHRLPESIAHIAEAL
jgi:hypothetical protein